jgi:mannonate dehydratase
MNLSDPNLFLLEEGFRWFGPGDPAPLAYIRQAGASALFTSLHQIPYGELWPREAIRERKKIIEAAGLRWTAVESVPVHEDIKTGRGDLKRLFDNYAATLRNLAAEGVTLVIYNFMPVLDWVRTDMRSALPDGSECMRFDPVCFAAFEIHALQRPGASDGYTAEQCDRAAAWWKGLDAPARDAFIRSIIDVFPGVKWALSLDDIRAMLARYEHVDSSGLRANLERFLQAVIPVAEEAGVRLAIHPDDPPFPVLGLPRIVSKAADIAAIFKMAGSGANGLCFCSGSFSARADNDLPAMAREFGPRIHAVHLRSTQRLPDGSFYEADHLAGSVDMPALVRTLLDEQDRRRAEGRADWRLPFRPDHGHTMMDDLLKPAGITPGYSCIGRMRGLAELRGLMLGLRYAGSHAALTPPESNPAPGR